MEPIGPNKKYNFLAMFVCLSYLYNINQQHYLWYKDKWYSTFASSDRELPEHSYIIPEQLSPEPRNGRIPSRRVRTGHLKR